MKKLIKMNKPGFDVEDVLNACMVNMLKERKEKFTAAISDFKNYAEEFDCLMKQNKAFELDENFKSSYISSKDAKNLYSDKMLDKDEPARHFYDKIKNSAPDGVCPICMHIEADTIDHYMAKSIYPFLSITPLNLIPICNKCNRLKHDSKATSQIEMTLHPYYDDFQQYQWLKSKIVNISHSNIDFFVDKSVNDYERLNNHLNIYKLSTRFRIYSKSELNARKAKWKKHYKNLGFESLKN